MRFRFHVLLAVLIALSFVRASGEVRPQTPATVADAEPALRQLADRFFHSMESVDFTEFLSLWSARPLDDAVKLRWAQLLVPVDPPPTSPSSPQFAYDATRIRVERLAIRRVEVNGDTGNVHVKVSISAVSKRTEKPLAFVGVGFFLGEDHFLTLRCVREAGIWKVLEPAGTEQDLARLVAQSDTAEKRTALLAENRDVWSRNLAWALDRESRPIGLYDFDKALVLDRLAIDIARQVDAKADVADLLNNLAGHYFRRGDQAHALQYYLEGLDINEHLDPDRPGAVNLLRLRGNIGELYARQGNYAQAVEWYRPAADPTDPSKAIPNYVWSTAHAYEKLGKYDRALEYLNWQLLISEQRQPPAARDEMVAGSLRAMGDWHVAQGHYAQGLESYEKAQHIVEAFKYPNRILPRSTTSGLLADIANAYLMQGQGARAVEFIERAMAIPTDSTSPIESPEVLLTAGRAYRAAGRNDRAHQFFDQAIAASEYRRTNAAGGDENRQRYFESLVAPYREIVSLMVAEKDPAGAFDYAERSKARALLDVLDSGKVEVTKGMTSEERARDLDFRRQLAPLNQALQSARQAMPTDLNRIRALEASLEKARLDYEAFQTRLYVAHPELQITRGEVKPITLGGTSALLPGARTALLEYVVTDERTYVFVITSATAQSSPVLHVYPVEIKEKDLQERVGQYRDKLATRDPEFLKSSRELFALLLGPAQAELRNSSVLVIVPDSVLWDLPFQALQSERQRYLIESHTVSYAPSLTALREMAKEGTTRKAGAASRLDLFALGNPVTSKQVEARAKTGLMDEALEPLPEAEKQVAELARLYGPAKSQVYTGAAATEQRAKADAPGARVIQFATHGILDSSSPMYSHLVLSPGAHDGDEDGLLETWEIMKLDLRAELVVLAACETARGRVGAGEGMIGMSWAFFVAGSPTTVASQWRVDSASTTQLMLEFHRNLIARTQQLRTPMSKARALQAAAVKLLGSRDYQHPFYWAGFVLIGDGS